MYCTDCAAMEKRIAHLEAENAALREQWEKAMHAAREVAGHEIELWWPPGAVAAIYSLRADKERLVEALDSLLPGFILDLRHCSEDDDKEALRSRVRTVTEAIDAARKEEPPVIS